jgi:hypothetical protein
VTARRPRPLTARGLKAILTRVGAHTHARAASSHASRSWRSPASWVCRARSASLNLDTAPARNGFGACREDGVERWPSRLAR